MTYVSHTEAKFSIRVLIHSEPPRNHSCEGSLKGFLKWKAVLLGLGGLVDFIDSFENHITSLLGMEDEVVGLDRVFIIVFFVY